MKSKSKELFYLLRSRVKDLYASKVAPYKFIDSSWRMILFISSLAILVIYSSHQVDRKVFQMSKLNEQLKDLRSKHIDMRTQLMSLSKLTKVAKDVQSIGLLKSRVAPFVLNVQE